jgi:hypothetical protein
MQNASNEEDEDCYQVRDNRRVNWRLICHAGGQCVGQVKSALNSAARWPSPLLYLSRAVFGGRRLKSA